MAISLKLKLHLHFRPKPFYTHTTRFCSSSSSSSSPFPKPQNDTETQNRFSTLDYIKNHLKQQQSFAPRFNNPKGAASVEEIRKNLSEFRLRSAAPPPTKPQISFQELYKKNAEANKETDKSRSTLSMDSIRQSLQKMRENAPKSNRERDFHPLSLSSFKSSFKLGPESGNNGRAIGEELLSEVFGKEMNEEKEVSGVMKMELLRMYNYEELGEKLRTLRPDGVDKKKEGWFSLTELNERLVKLREIEEIEERQMQSRQPGGVKLYSILRNSLGQIKDPDDRPNMMGVQRLDIWNELSDTPDYMKHPPKEHLVEKARKMNRPGDWNCKLCMHLNFQRRDSCQRCGDAKGEYGGRTNGVSFTGADVRPGDWYCAAGNCGTHNFASRSSCFKCGAFKDDIAAAGGGFDFDMPRSRGLGFATSSGNARSGWKSGDWICTRLEQLGGLERKLVLNGQAWRLISCIWLHAGVIYMFSLLLIGIRLEQEFGFLIIGTLYVFAGLGGSLLSSLIVDRTDKATISVGASGALFGLLGAMLSELMTNWSIYANKCTALTTLVLVLGLNLAVGLIPNVDSSVHIGGFVAGFFLGFVLLFQPQFGYVSSKHMPPGYNLKHRKSNYRWYQYVFWVIGLAALIAGYAVALYMLFSGQTVEMHFFKFKGMNINIPA